MYPDEIEDRDPGLARERTALAWTRTAMAVAAVGGAILKRNVPIGMAVLAMSPLIWASARLRGKAPVARPGRLLLITVAIVVVAIAALVAAFLAPGPHHPG
jgi:uncharacterized membrane protein YidH (DUF202 family)